MAHGRTADAARAGVTLVEILVSMTVLSVVLVSGMAYMATQTRAFATSVERTTALTRSRYVTETVQRDLRALGSNLVAGQPGLVYAGGDVIAFNADFASNVAGDVFAVYVDPDTPAGQVSAPGAAFTIPGTAVSYGGTPYLSGAGTPSGAETIVLFLRPDSSTAATDDFVLFRQVNDTPAEEVSTGIRRLDAQPFFEYWMASEGGTGLFEPLADSVLPVQHAAPYHLSPADTGQASVIDSVRAVAIRFAVWPAEDTTLVRPLTVDRTISLPNAGVQPVASCGTAPLLGDTLVLSASVAVVSADTVVELAWPRALDEGGGEADVVRYVLWRRMLPDTAWGDPQLSVPAGSSSYGISDMNIQSGATYEYAVAAQDCTPTMSSIRRSGLVIVP